MSENINIKSEQIKCVAHGQAVVEARQPIEGDVKVLSIDTQASVYAGEVFTGEARYTGRVVFDCLALVDGKPASISLVADFSDKLTSAEIVAGSKLALVPEVVNAEYAVDGGVLRTVAVVDTRAYGAVGGECACVTATDDGVYAQKRTVQYCAVPFIRTEPVYVADSITAAKTDTVMYSVSRANITDAVAEDGAVKLSGSVYTFITLDGANGISSVRVVTPFTKSIADPAVKSGGIVNAYALVCDSSATVDADAGTLNISATLNITVAVQTPCSVEIVTDAFCAENELECERGEIVSCTVEPTVTVADAVDGQVALPADKPAADSVLCVSGVSVNLTSVTSDGKPTVEGVVGGDIVYYNAETAATDTMAFRIPFALRLSAQVAAETVEATAIVTDITVRVRRESVFDIKADLAFTVTGSTSVVQTCVAGIKKGAAIPKPDASVIVHIAAPGETLWQAARALCCSPETVTELNPIEPPYSGGERLIGYVRGRK